MPRDKKIIHRATSDVEDEVLSEEEGGTSVPPPIEKNECSTIQDSNDLTEERKKHLKDAILKRTQALKQQRERDRQQRVSSTQNK
ncbi:hypothetical protein WIV_gp168 [Wiseana iridescent virus]|uniref:Uncharacterized protein n=1 Tax=Wiseana iridescent virus TaxID=68347 RepID=G0T5J4_IRV9|nr:hypothetical protein WIV_gp168 [Wiseana iridescent virus]ADO00512.1 hypothetical protein [Wiseana iridescent virus]